MTGEEALAYLVLDPGTPGQTEFPIFDRIFVGRECAGIEPVRRVLIDDPAVSRNHLEIRLERDDHLAFVVDTSTNGTRLNGARIERGSPVLVRPGDKLTVGTKVLEFRSEGFRSVGRGERLDTMKRIESTTLGMVVGDIVSYSTISEYTEDRVLIESVDRLYGELREVLAKHRGILNNYVGDAFFAIWEPEHDPEAATNAVRFAIDASRRVQEIAPSLPLRDAEGNPIRMGWGATLGSVAISSLTGMLVTVLGDAANVAFRISGLAGRNGRDEILVVKSLHDAVEGEFAFGPPEDVAVKGRTGAAKVYGLRVSAPG